MEPAAGDAAEVAERPVISRNNFKVRRHRVRQALRERLEETCRLCAKHGCLDCTCNRKQPVRPPVTRRERGTGIETIG